MFFKIKKMPENALIYCQFNIAQRIIIEDIGNIIKGALEVFSSVLIKSVVWCSFWWLTVLERTLNGHFL